MGRALEMTSSVLTQNKQKEQPCNADTNDDLFEDVYKTAELDDIHYDTGGRIREAFAYCQNPGAWKREKMEIISKITKEPAILPVSVIETKGIGDPKSPDRIRSMFRNITTLFWRRHSDH